MKKILIVIIIISPTILFGQTDKLRKEFVFETNLPDEVRDFYQEKIKKNYALRTNLNPFYLRGDFDGDKKNDYAISVIERGTDKAGILIYHTGTKKHFLLGAGKGFNGRNPGDNFWWMDAWRVTMDNDKKNGESILAIKTESASGLIYWTGQEYKWLQQGD